MASNLDELYLQTRPCSICFEDAQNQPMRSCSHVICEKCNANFINSNSDRECQLCIATDFDSSDSDDGSYLTPLKPPIPQQRSTTRKLCASCYNDEPAVAHCRECMGFICQTCCQQHAKLSALRNHNLSKIIPQSSPTIRSRQHVDQLPSLPAVPPKTYEELIEQLKKLKLKVQEKTQTLSVSMTEAEKDIEANASSFVQNAVEESEKTKRELDRQILEYAQKISRQKDKLLLRLKRRQNYVKQTSQMINSELEKTEAQTQQLLADFNRYSINLQGYTNMNRSNELQGQRQNIRIKLQSLQKRHDELTFTYTPPTGTTSSLGKIEALRKWNRITDSCVQRIRRETDYIASSMLSAPNNNILFTSYKGSTKAALDLVNRNGNEIHSRKLQDNGQDPVFTPAFGTMIDDGMALMGWETTVFSLKMSTQDKVDAIGVKSFLVPNAKICCIACSHDLKEVAVGNDKNRIINIFDFNMNFQSSVAIKEEGPPLFSLVFHGDLILFTDGVSAALAVDRNGNTIAQFPSPGLYDSQPLAIDSSQELVYILWKNHSSNGGKHKAIVQCYNMQKHSALGSPVGEALEVPEETKFIAVMRTPDGDDKLVTGSSDGGMAVHCIQEI